MNSRVIAYLLMVVLFGYESALAKELKTSQSFDHAAIDIGDPMVLTAEDYGLSSNGTDCKNAEGRVALVVDRAYSNPISLSHSLDIAVRIRAYGQNNTSPYFDENRTLSVDPRNVVQASVSVIDQIDLPGAHKIQVDVLTVKSNGSNVSCPANVSLRLSLYSHRIKTNPSLSTLNLRHELHNSNANPSLMTGTDKDTEYALADYMLVKWDAIDFVEGYELEWTYVDNYTTTANVFNVASSLNFGVDDMRFNASRIFVDGNEFRIPLLYDKGFLVYRLRALYKVDCSVDYLRSTTWTSASCATTLDCFSPNYQRLAGHERALNWQASRSFTEGARSKEMVSYFDGSHRNRQSIAYINSTGNSIVTEQYYDYAGRPAVQSLPVPGEAKINFHDNFNQSSSQDFGPANFDVDGSSCGVEIDAMDNNSGTARYFSSNNPDQSGANAYIPDANGFPFAQIEYEPDNTGRVRRQGGVGENYQLGSGHETQYFYGTPDQEELDRLFGTEVGYARYYKKVVVIDPNGQASITYYDQSEKVIATALTGNVPANLQALGGGVTPLTSLDMLAKDAAGDADDEQDRNFSMIDSLGLEANYHLIYPSRDDFSSAYSVSIPIFTDACFDEGVAYAPVVQVNTNIYDDRCQIELDSKEGQAGDVNTSATTPSTLSLNSEVLSDLDAGSYKVAKTLRIDEDAMEQYAESYLEDANCLTPFSTFLTREMNEMDFSPCDELLDDSELSSYEAYDECTSMLGSPANYSSQAEYDALLEECMDPYTVPQIFDQIYFTMLQDVSPGGQYGSFDVDANGDYYSEDPLSVFNDNSNADYPNLLPVYVIGSSITYPGSGLTISEIIEDWDPQYAIDLLPYHPEYKYWNEYYLDYRDQSVTYKGLNTQEYEYLLGQVRSYTDLGALNDYYKVILASSGTFQPVTGYSSTNFPILNEDPYFQQSSPSTAVQAQKTALLSRLQDVDGNGTSLYDFAAFEAHCSNWHGTNACTGVPSYGTTMDAKLQEKEWRFLWSTYYSLKQEVIYAWANGEALNIGGPGNGYCNTAIGEQGFSGPSYLINRYVSIGSVPAAMNSYSGVLTEAYRQTICGIHADIYEQKQKRFAFYDPYLLSSNSSGPAQADVEQELYERTNICPHAHYLKGFIRDVFVNHDPYPASAYALLYVDGFSKTLYDLIAPSGSYQAYTWDASIDATSKKLTVDLNYSSPINDFLKIDFDPNSSFDWTTTMQFREVRSLVPDPSLNTGSRYGFAMEVEIDYNGVTVTEVLTGTVANLDIQTCANVITNQSHGNVQGSAYANLFNLLLLNGDFDGTSINLLNSTYADAFNSSLRPVLENSVGQSFTGFTWSQSSATEYYINTNNSNVAFRILFCNSPSFNFSATDYHFADLKQIDPASSPSCSNLSQSPNFEVTAKTVSYSGSTPIETPTTLYGYIDAYDPAPVSGAAPYYLASIDLGYTGRPLESDPGFKESCEAFSTARSALQSYLNVALGLAYSGIAYYPDIYTGTHQTDVLAPILSQQIGEPVFRTGWQPYGIGVAYYTAFQNPDNHSEYLGFFYNGHGLVEEPEMNYDSETGEYSPDLTKLSWNAVGLYDCQVRMNFVDQISAYEFDDVIEFTNLQGVPGTFVDGLTNQFTVWALLSSGEYVKVQGESCFMISECVSCTKQVPRVPTNCWADFSDYQNEVESPLGLDAITEAEFCSWGITCLDEYITYLSRMNIGSVNSPYYVSLVDFCNRNMDYYLDTYFAYVPIILGNGTAQNFSSYLPGTYTGQFALISHFAENGISLSCVQNYDTYLSSATYPQNIISYCSNYTADIPCPNLDFRPFPGLEFNENECDSNLIRIATHNALIAYQSYLDSVKADFKIRYRTHILENAVETFDRTCNGTSDEHFMLYYYDQAGNLTKTIPPNAVATLGSGSLAAVKASRNSNGATVEPSHNQNLATVYTYNSLNQLVLQSTPDAGLSQFWYDDLGRIVFSQNAKQAVNEHYSYSIYDNLGRITEVGQFEYSGAAANLLMFARQANWPRNISASLDLEEVTHTFYDVNPFSSGNNSVETYYQNLETDFALKNLQNRIVVSATYASLLNGAAADESFDHATYFSYDVHGNVKTLIQDFHKEFDANGEEHLRFKRIDYVYDLISGNTNKVIYQPFQQDKICHHYVFDADNRIKEVYTSKDNKTWDIDAKYQYLNHGPLARVEIGQAKVQGEDYAYVLQGWLKAVNSSLLDKDLDQGSDGLTNHVARDAFAFSLHYNSDDYSSISGTGAPFLANINSIGTANLYNGNIMAMVTSFWDNVEDPVRSHANRYTYDQLNRLVSSYTFKDRNTGADQVVANNSFATATENGDYRTTYSYDANGNILSLNRKGYYSGSGTQGMDNLSYNYYTNTNKLSSVDDIAPSGNYSADLEDQTSENYGYDAIGNLVRDDAEEIDAIQWTLDGKVSKIRRTSSSIKPDLEFRYDAVGNRILKIEKPISGDHNFTFYIRDAAGKTLATYSKSGTGPLYLREQTVYGLDRIGVIESSKEIDQELIASNCQPSQSAGVLTLYERIRYWHPCFVSGSNTYNEALLDVASGGGDEIVMLKALEGDLIIEAQTGTFTDTKDGSSKVIYTLEPNESIVIEYSDLVILTTTASYEMVALSSYVDHEFVGVKQDLGSLTDGWNTDQKQYELKNHLGNVLATVADYKYWKTYATTTSVIDEDFTQAGDFSNYSPIGDPELVLDDENGLYTVNGQGAEDGISREFTVANDNCDYVLCVTVTYEELNGELILRVIEGGSEVTGLTIEEPGEYCFDLSESGAGSYSFELLSSEADVFSLSYVSLEKTCETKELVADVLESQDYYPFGMIMPGRNFSGSYRYGFNGMEEDPEINGAGNSLDFGSRLYDPRLSRWNIVDPQSVRGPSLSPYNYAFNNPVDYIDSEGEWASKWSLFWDWLNNADYAGELYENSAAKDGDDDKYGVKIGDNVYYNKDDLTLATLDAWDLDILFIGLDKFAPKHPQDKAKWDKKDLRDKLDLAKKSQWREGMAELFQEEMEPIKELYQIGLGPSGLANGIRLTSTVAKTTKQAIVSRKAFWSGDGTAKAAAEAGFDLLGDTPEGQRLAKFTAGWEWDYMSPAYQLWGELSKRWAQSVEKGSKVVVFITREKELDPKSIWNVYERPELVKRGCEIIVKYVE